jgi:hypothetical protein
MLLVDVIILKSEVGSTKGGTKREFTALPTKNRLGKNDRKNHFTL